VSRRGGVLLRLWYRDRRCLPLRQQSCPLDNNRAVSRRVRRSLAVGAFFDNLLGVVRPCFPLYSDKSCTGCRPGDREPTMHRTSLSLRLKEVGAHRLLETPLFTCQNKSLHGQGLKAHCNQTWAAHFMRQITQDPLGSTREKIVDI